MRGIALFGLGLAVALPVLSIDAGSAKADDAYVCDSGRIVYVKLGSLEQMKRTDPCIAAHYGIELNPAKTLAEPAADVAEIETVVEPQRRQDDDVPAMALVRTGSEPRHAKIGARIHPDAKKHKGQGTVQLVGTVGRIVERAPPAPPLAHPETDFRNVRVLNAQPGDSALYRHLR